MRSQCMFSIVCTAAVFLSACSSYNTDFPPPADNAKIGDIVPAKIDNQRPKFRRSGGIGGAEAVYGENRMLIRIIRLADHAQAEAGFKKEIIPMIDSMSNRLRGKINGVWRAKGTDSTGRIWYSWVNGKYVFVINAKDRASFKRVVASFRYISE